MHLPVCFKPLWRLLMSLGLLMILAGNQPVWAQSFPTVPSESIVKVYVTSKSTSNYAPWNSDTVSSSGSGFMIEGKRILTNAHVVANQIFVEIQRDGNPKRYQASVEAVSHEMDIAILQVKDESFFAKGTPLVLGDLPELHQQITVHGYPVGGDTLSTTRGIVSRIEYLTYYHSGLSYQMIQIDAAINAGNSGGPAMSNGKVIGVVTQKADGVGENIGYIIPVSMVKRFLHDLEDGVYNGFPAFSVQFEYLLSPVLKKKYQLADNQTGVLINKVCANTSAEKVLKVGDVITHIDGKSIDDDGTSSLTEHKTISFLHYVDMHLVGDTLNLGIMREGKPLQVQVLLDEIDKSDNTYDKDPRYFIYGGFVFNANELPDSCLTREKYDENKQKNKKDDVSITQVLTTAGNIGFHDLGSMKIEKINGKRFDTFKEFYQILKNTNGPFVELEDTGGYEVAIDRQQAAADHQAVLEQYRIQQPQSKEIDQWEQEWKTVQKP